MSWFVLRWMDWFWMGKEGKMEMVYGDEGRVVNRFRFDIAIKMEWKSAYFDAGETRILHERRRWECGPRYGVDLPYPVQ